MPAPPFMWGDTMLHQPCLVKTPYAPPSASQLRCFALWRSGWLHCIAVTHKNCTVTNSAPSKLAIAKLRRQRSFEMLHAHPSTANCERIQSLMVDCFSLCMEWCGERDAL
jgi:hypothetical protein